MKTTIHQSAKRVVIVIVSGIWLSACSGNIEIPKEVQAYQDKLPDQVDYNLHVKPILSDRCFKCHGPDKNKIEAGLQLANFTGATMELKSGAKAIDPGNLTNSEMVYRILSKDPEEVMPTPESHLTLSNEEKAILIKWVEQGAKYKEHWSLTKIEDKRVPAVGKNIFAQWGIMNDEETDWVKNEIDHFALAKMKERGLKPSSQASKTTLLRRVYLDLTGLPPTPAQVDSFLNNTSANAYEQVVDRLMKSPHYGEHQAVSWLDLARYADSHGYQDDIFRNSFPYRDWVINSFNQNLPFDKFILYQLAGDLMPNPTREMMVATSFNRQHPQSAEGGIVEAEYRTEYVADRVNTFGKGLLGLTMECSRCHDHKYDPILQKDYFSLYAFFNQVKEGGQISYSGEASPTILLPDKNTEKILSYIKNEIGKGEKVLSSTFNQTDFQNWLKNKPTKSTLENGLLVYLPMDGADAKNKYLNKVENDFEAVLSGDLLRKPTIQQMGKVGKAVEFHGECGIEIYSKSIDKDKEGKDKDPKERFGRGLNFERNQAFSVNLWVNPMKDSIHGSLFQKTGSMYSNDRGYILRLNKDRTLTVTFSYIYPANCIEIQTKNKLGLKQWQNIALNYDGSGKAKGIELYLNGKKLDTRIITDNLNKGLLYAEKKETFYYANFWIGKELFRKEIDNLLMDEFRIYNRKLSQLEITSLAAQKDELNNLMAKPTQSLSKTETDLLREHYTLLEDKNYRKIKSKLDSLRGQEVAVVTEVPEVSVMQELPTDQQRKSYILNRGVYDALGEEVTAETPIKLGKLPSGYPRNRLGLAQWLLSEDNTLFARVMANRLWLQFFGNGLVKTQEDFGNQGELPSHPELLDWLAIQFRKDNWDTKKFIKRMVMSATYQQSSIADKDKIEADPDNKWLARGSSYRLTAEQVRDIALVSSGLLVRQIGGPSVYPYQPSGIWEQLGTHRNLNYFQQHGDSLYRRSMYTIWKRASPPPMMLNFDSPDRSLCVVRRQKTATPLQALVTMNDPQFVEAGRVLAEKSMKAKNSMEERIQLIFKSTISRDARPTEMKVLHDLFQEELKSFQSQPTDAEKLLAVGEYPSNKNIDRIELAALTVVANTILNYDEATIKR